jgi:glycerophosphoryl diester phosphodiesterase
MPVLITDIREAEENESSEERSEGFLFLGECVIVILFVISGHFWPQIPEPFVKVRVLEMAPVLAALRKVRLVPHGLGALGSKLVSNSKEALLQQYGKGHRVFEVDLKVDSNGEIVCNHGPDFRGGVKWTLADLKAKLSKNYTVMSLKEFAEVLHDYKDIFFLTDLKDKAMICPPNSDWFWKQFVSTIKKVDVEVLDRAVPTVARIEELQSIRNAWNWSVIGIDLWSPGIPIEKWRKFLELVKIKANRIKIVSIDLRYACRFPEFSSEMRAAGAAVFPWTVNDVQWIKSNSTRYLFSGYYTDFLSPSREISDSFPHDARFL